MQISNELIKMCSRSFAVQEMQIKTTMVYNFTHTEELKSKSG